MFVITDVVLNLFLIIVFDIVCFQSSPIEAKGQNLIPLVVGIIVAGFVVIIIIGEPRSSFRSMVGV